MSERHGKQAAGPKNSPPPADRPGDGREWLKVMLDEIRRKQSELEEEQRERRRRDNSAA